MRLLPRRYERPMYGQFNDLAEALSSSSELLSRTMAQNARDRQRLLPQMRENSNRAAEIAGRIGNQLVESLITPFEAEVLHGIAYTMADTCEQMESVARLLDAHRIPKPSDHLIRSAGLVERCTDITVEAVWALATLRSQEDYHLEMRRLARHIRSLVETSRAERYDAGGAAADLLRSRDVHEAMLGLTRLLEQIGRSADLLRVRDA